MRRYACGSCALKFHQIQIEWAGENILLAARMGGMGVAIGSMAGEVAANYIIEKI